MTNNNASWERLESVIRWANMTINYFGRHIGLVRSEIIYQIKAGKNGISFSLAQRIVDKFPEISLGWLLSGEGDMFGREQSLSAVPFYEGDLLAARFDLRQMTPSAHFTIPLAERCDLAFRSMDVAMSDEIAVGSIVFLKKTPIEAIISGAIYVIVSPNYVFLRRVRVVDDGYLSLEPLNASYDKMRLATEQVMSLYQVVGNLKLY